MTDKKNENLAPVSNPELQTAIENLRAAQTAENQKALFEAMKNARLLIPAVVEVQFAPNKFGKIQQVRSPKIKFPLARTNDGHTYFPAFSDLTEAKKMNFNDGKNVQYVVRTLKDYRQMLNNPGPQVDGILLNPATVHFPFPKGLVEALCDNLTINIRQQAAAAAVQGVYGEPAVYPTQMVNAVHDACRSLSGVNRVWLKSLVSGPAMSYALIVDAEAADDALFAKIRAAAEPASKGIPVVVQAYTEELEKKAIQGAFPLFDKELDV